MPMAAGDSQVGTDTHERYQADQCNVLVTPEILNILSLAHMFLQ
jgi:hypothetical protein